MEKSEQTKKQPADDKRMKIEALEARIAPAAVANKKQPVPPPYAPGTLYGLACRANLRY
ncbi:MAG: hypothetical protein GXP54_01955 [Deltaproteobacteria bacterium]|nr:hypothetical protein [Deltaproteobacteria bacterium]